MLQASALETRRLGDPQSLAETRGLDFPRNGKCCVASRIIPRAIYIVEEKNNLLS
jgi:hypothetical protein